MPTCSNPDDTLRSGLSSDSDPRDHSLNTTLFSVWSDIHSTTKKHSDISDWMYQNIKIFKNHATDIQHLWSLWWWWGHFSLIFENWEFVHRCSLLIAGRADRAGSTGWTAGVEISSKSSCNYGGEDYRSEFRQQTLDICPARAGPLDWTGLSQSDDKVLLPEFLL